MLIPIFSFIVSCYILNFSYPILINKLDENTPNFDKLNDIKKHYVVKNLLKTVYLCVLCIFGFPFLIFAMYNYFPNIPIKILASLYCSNDCVGLYKVKQLPTSTRLHHIVTSIFLMCTYATNFQENKIGQMLFYYTYFSACAFPVNAYLGLRYCYDYNEIEKYHYVAKHIYPLCCIVNWIIQFYMIGNTFYDFAYIFLLLFIVFDDLYLLRWLWKPIE